MWIRRGALLRRSHAQKLHSTFFICHLSFTFLPYWVVKVNGMIRFVLHSPFYILRYLFFISIYHLPFLLLRNKGKWGYAEQRCYVGLLQRSSILHYLIRILHLPFTICLFILLGSKCKWVCLAYGLALGPLQGSYRGALLCRDAAETLCYVGALQRGFAT